MPLSDNNIVTGMRVVLDNLDADRPASYHHPAVGSSYECDGRITDIDKYIRVSWNNGRAGMYDTWELSVAEDQDIVSIWD